jgi:RNA polymerase sigma-70 factor (ECF subfamily)
MTIMTARGKSRRLIRPDSGSPGDYSSLPDQQLIDYLALRDVGAFETLYDRHGTLIYSMAKRVVGDEHVAEDITQEVFLRVWRQPERYVAEKGGFVTWLLSVTRNRAVDLLRTRQRRRRLEATSLEQQERELPCDGVPDPALSAELADQRRTVLAALATLSQEQRQVIDLAYFGGLTQREVAHRLGQPLGTVKTRIRLGMQKLRVALAHEPSASNES